MKRIVFLICLAVLGGCTQQKAKRLAAAQLIDPSSAQFRNVRTVSNAAGSRVCGEINGKNRMGAYAGFVRFIVNPTIEYVELDQPQARSPEVALEQLDQCRRPSYGGYIRDCSYDQERYAEAVLAEGFARNWQRYCEPASAGAAQEANVVMDTNMAMDANMSLDSNVAFDANMSGE